MVSMVYFIWVRVALRCSAFGVRLSVFGLRLEDFGLRISAV